MYFRNIFCYEIANLWVEASTFRRFFQKPFDPDNRTTYKTNANPKMTILMSENIGQRRLNFLWNISILYIIIIFNQMKFYNQLNIHSTKQLKVTIYHYQEIH